MSWDEAEEKNAVIEDTFFGIGHPGILTFSLTLDYGGTGQATPLYCLAGGEPREYSSVEVLEKVLDVVGVDRWEELKGKHIRVVASHHCIHKIGNILENKWLDFEEFFSKDKKVYP